MYSNINMFNDKEQQATKKWKPFRTYADFPGIFWHIVQGAQTAGHPRCELQINTNKLITKIIQYHFVQTYTEIHY